MNANFGILDALPTRVRGQARPLRQALRARAGSARRHHRPIRIEELTMAESIFRGTTICAVRKNGECAMAGDGQVTMGQQTVMKAHAHKVRRIYNGKVVVGFAGSRGRRLRAVGKVRGKADAVLRQPAPAPPWSWRRTGAWTRPCANWRPCFCAPTRTIFFSSAARGEVIEPDDGVLTIGSGGNYALAAARALFAEHRPARPRKSPSAP